MFAAMLAGAARLSQILQPDKTSKPMPV